MDRFQGRRAVTIESDAVRVSVLEEGGHIAEVFHKPTGVNPLWVPHWPSTEPSDFDPSRHSAFATGADGKLLAGIMGHNLCLDIFGPPSDSEAAAGLTAHGEAPVAPFTIERTDTDLLMHADLPMAGLRVRRTIRLHQEALHVREAITNLTACDRPVGWTEHVTLAAPFLRPGATQFRVSATRSKVFESPFGPSDYLAVGAEFDWPLAPRTDGGQADLQIYSSLSASSAYTAHLMDTRREHAFFVAFTPEVELAFGYVWKRADFPWLGRWEENRSRSQSPWNRQALTCGLEFGVSPFPETRRQMIDRRSLFDVPTYRWIPARTAIEVEYWIVTRRTTAIPEQLQWPAVSTQ